MLSFFTLLPVLHPCNHFGRLIVAWNHGVGIFYPENLIDFVLYILSFIASLFLLFLLVLFRLFPWYITHVAFLSLVNTACSVSLFSPAHTTLFLYIIILVHLLLYLINQGLLFTAAWHILVHHCSVFPFLILLCLLC